MIILQKVCRNAGGWWEGVWLEDQLWQRLGGVGSIQSCGSACLNARWEQCRPWGAGPVLIEFPSSAQGRRLRRVLSSNSKNYSQHSYCWVYSYHMLSTAQSNSDESYRNSRK